MRDCEVAIIGGGPAGCAAAIALARAGVEVAIVHASRAASPFVETLPPGARPLLASLGLWPSGRTGAQTPAYANESVWGSPLVARTDFTFDPNGQGWHIDRDQFDQASRAVARDCGAEVIDHAKVDAVDRRGDGWEISFSRDRSSARVRAHRIIDSTGRSRWLARQCGAQSIAEDALVGVVAALFPRLDGMIDADQTTFVEACEDGWWFTAVTPSGRRVVAYFTDAAHPSARHARDIDGFRDLWRATAELQHRVRLQDWHLDRAPQIRSSGTSRLKHVGGDGWLAIGDAVISVDPISSQGIMTAAYTGLRAGEAIAAAANWDAVLAGYGERCDQVFDAYLASRRQCYGEERRWSNRPFWRSRQPTSPSSVGTLDDPGRDLREARVQQSR